MRMPLVNSCQGSALPRKLRAELSIKRTTLVSPNVLAGCRAPTQPLSNEHVVFSALSITLGVGTPVDGDSIYNGAMDNAAGELPACLTSRQFSWKTESGNADPCSSRRSPARKTACSARVLCRNSFDKPVAKDHCGH